MRMSTQALKAAPTESSHRQTIFYNSLTFELSGQRREVACRWRSRASEGLGCACESGQLRLPPPKELKARGLKFALQLDEASKVFGLRRMLID